MTARRVAASKRSTPAYLLLLVLTCAAPLVPLRALAAPADPDARAAEQAFKDGEVAFNLGQWDKAIEAWQRGYKLKQNVVFLYNLAQAYRKKGDAEQSIFFYKNYLRNTSNAPNRDEVLGWIDQLEKQLADERQRKADQDKQQQAADDAARKATIEEAARRQAAADAAAAATVVKPRALRGDLGLSAGVNLYLAGLSQSRSPSAAVELTGGYTLVERGRLRFRLGATFGFTYLIDVSDEPVNLISLLVDPTLKVDLWKQKLFFFVEVGLGAVIITGIPRNTASALLDAGKGATGTFAAFEARPAIGLEYQPIRRLSINLAPGVAITTPPTGDFNTLVRLQILAGISIKL